MFRCSDRRLLRLLPVLGLAVSSLFGRPECGSAQTLERPGLRDRLRPVDLPKMTWTVEGTRREGLVHVPERLAESGVPLVFGFHGHGGSSLNAARTFRLHQLWPEAIVVYLQGLKTPGPLTDPEGKRSGWQHQEGEQNDRDLKLVDAVLADLKQKYPIDEDRIYSTGHSNGGGFTYLLWATRPQVFAAMAPSAAGSRNALRLTPKPAMHIAGTNDQLVKFAGQQLTMKAVRLINECGPEGKPWAPGCIEYPSPKQAVFVSFIHSGTHKYPPEAPELIVRFFKQHRRIAGTQDARPGVSQTPLLDLRQRFDKNGDGRLDAEERAALRDYLRES